MGEHDGIWSECAETSEGAGRPGSVCRCNRIRARGRPRGCSPRSRSLAPVGDGRRNARRPCARHCRQAHPGGSRSNILASEVFGWCDEKAWWRNSRIALDSPLTSACRFESEPFWVNAQGFRTRQPNRYLAAIDLTNFAARAMTRAAIVVPVHLPFGQIGAVSFNPLDPALTELEEASTATPTPSGSMPVRSLPAMSTRWDRCRRSRPARGSPSAKWNACAGPPSARPTLKSA